MNKMVTAMLVFCMLSGSVHASSLMIVRGQDFPPYHFLDKNGKETGFIVEIITQVAETLNLDIEFSQYPWSRCLKMVETGEADAMMNLFKTQERQAYMYFSENILALEVNRFFKLDTSPVSFDGNIQGLKGLRIGAIRNYSYGKTFDELSSQLNILRLETEKSLLLNLFNKRCDIILGNDIVLNTLAKEISGGERLVSIGPRITQDPLYLGFSKIRGHKTLSDKFSIALKRFKVTPEYQHILEKYGL